MSKRFDHWDQAELERGAIAVFWSELGQKPVTPAMIRLFKDLVPFEKGR